MSFTKRGTIWGRGLALTTGLAGFAAAATASAFVAPTGARVAGRLEPASGAVRSQRDVAAQPPAATPAHRALTSALGAAGSLWDRDTGVPLRIWGAGVDVPGSVASAEVAARGARELLARHLDALAPGSRVDDFVLVGNDLDAGIRTVGFAQTHRGRRVLGGQVSFRFKRDRLVAVGSEALPRVQAALAATPVAADDARARATAWVLRDAAKQATAGAVEGPFILPLVEPGRVRGYREVLRVTVDAGQPIGRWAVYVDAATGEPVAREQTLHFASGTVLFDVPQRGPKGARIAAPAPLLNVFVNGSPSATDLAGTATIPDGGPSSVVAGVQGALVTVQQESGPPAVQDLALAPGGQALWSAPLDEILDAQLSAYIHANIVKQRVKAIAPGFAYLDQNLPVVVNINDICNAFSDGDQINFFLSGQGCENTARIADVVYHEFGHSVHVQSIVEGGGLFEGALSEGISDYLSATITNDSGLARGFFVDIPNDPLRELDPVGDEARWPDDLTGEVHEDGLIIAGTLWDLRKLMIAKHGPATGVALTDNLWFQSIRRAIDIPTMYPEALLADDDDGNLANGTPNACEINQAFFAHGLLGAGSISGAVTLGPQQPEGFLVDLALAGGATACVDVAPLGATLHWRVQKTGDVGVNSMSPGPNGFAGLLPIQPDGTLLEYQVVVDLSDGSELSFPRNPGDPWYQVYIGPVTPLFCTAFEVPPADEGFVLTGQSEWGVPLGQGGDPAAAFDGGQVVGTNLSGTYLPLAGSAIVSPAIATLDFPTVRLQYRRWLTVEDGFFDAATIVANGAPAWQNFNSNNPDAATTHTRDEEWRFHDVDLTPFVIDGTVQLSFELAADGGLEMGGWNLDQLCVVGTDQSATAVCGNGVVEPPETCDAGPNNSNSLPDACRFDCQPARCGDLVIDAGEACDDGNAAAGDGCSAACQPEAITGDDTTDLPTTSIGGPGGDDDTDTDTGATDSAAGDDDLADRGCACTTGGGPAPVGLGLLVLLALRRRRR